LAGTEGNSSRLIRRSGAEAAQAGTTGEMKNRFLMTVTLKRASVLWRAKGACESIYDAAPEWLPPTFVLFTDRVVKLHFSYPRFLGEPDSGGVRFVGSPLLD